MSDNSFFWCVRGGETGQADHIFRKDKYLAIGWSKAGDLSKLPPDRDVFKKAVAEAYPETKRGAIPVHAGVLYRFVHEMKPGDLVVYPSKIDMKFHLGRIDGDFEYAPNRSGDYPNQRKVTWLKTVPRTYFTQGALNETNSPVTVFQIRNYADEFQQALLGQDLIRIDTAEDETVEFVARGSEETTRDFIRKRLSTALKGYPFESFVAELLRAIGYRVRVTQKSGDGGVDVIAHRDELGLEPPIIKVQAKSTDGTIGDPEVSALYGKVDPTEVGLFVTLGGFSARAKSFAGSKHNLRLVDGEELVSLVMEHYEDLDTKYQAMIPLKKIYVPMPIELSEEEQ